MTPSLRKPELLAPAGNFEKLETAVHYGADAVYIAGKDFSLRNFSGNFSDDELPEAVKFARKHNIKIYIACNVYPRSRDLNPIADFFKTIAALEPDAVIISDPGIIRIAKHIIPDIDIHLSTQANTTNIEAVRFWNDLGIKRVNLARELPLDEIKEITAGCRIETETFVHGAMCMAYSGRCLLSSFLSGRDSNQGLCSHPCRWKYSVIEELRTDQYHPVMEDSRGSYIFSSKDLCMIGHIPELVDAQISSLKIEGRMKGINYLASVVKTYRNAIDAYVQSPGTYKVKPEWMDELYQVYHREYCTGFYFGPSNEQSSNLDNTHQGKIHSFIGKITDKKSPSRYLVDIRNRLFCEDTVEIISPAGPPKISKVLKIDDGSGTRLEKTNPNTRVCLELAVECEAGDIIRKL